MNWIALILSILWLASCAARDRSSLVPIPASPESARLSPPTRSVELAPAAVITSPIASATPIGPAPTSAPGVRTQPTATSAWPECPTLPAPIAVKTRAAVQHFEHGLMFWLRDRAEVWALIASPLKDQFYWRVLPNLWAEGQRESDPAVQPPVGRFQPVRGFGDAWRRGGGSHGPQRTDLGWAIDEEAGFDTALIYYPQGFYSPDCTWLPKSGIYELTDERGTVYQFVGAGGIAKIVTSNE